MQSSVQKQNIDTDNFARNQSNSHEQIMQNRYLQDTFLAKLTITESSFSDEISRFLNGKHLSDLRFQIFAKLKELYCTNMLIKDTFTSIIRFVFNILILQYMHVIQK